MSTIKHCCDTNANFKNAITTLVLDGPFDGASISEYNTGITHEVRMVMSDKYQTVKEVCRALGNAYPSRYVGATIGRLLVQGELERKKISSGRYKYRLKR